jgi:glycerate dehydrogenase
MHHHIVALERINQPLPDSFAFPPGDTYTLTIHEAADASQLRARAAPATILLVTTIKLTAEILAPEVTPHLQYIACLATGIDIIDLEACKKRGIRVTNTPSANLDSVSEHAMSLYFAGRRKTAMLDRLTRSVPSDWKKKGSLTGVLRFADGKPPLTCKDEVMGIIGYGPLGEPDFPGLSVPTRAKFELRGRKGDQAALRDLLTAR